MRRFYAPIEVHPYARFRLDAEQSRHAQRVLRLQPADEIRVFDGLGNEFVCIIQEFRNKFAYARVVKQVEPLSKESSLNLTLAVALIKRDKFDLVIQKAVELGVTSLVPITTMRSEIRLKNVEKKCERWRKIIIESSKQCGRAKLMELYEPHEFEEFVETADGIKVLFAEKNGSSFPSIKADKKITAVVGPEGGWDNKELEIARKNNFVIITFGGRILRAETAAISISTILQHQFGDLN